MTEGKRRDDWDKPAWLLCHLMEPHRDRRSHPKAFQPREFNPLTPARKKSMGSIKLLKFFVNGSLPPEALN